MKRIKHLVTLITLLMASSALAFEPFTIKDIKVEGLQKVSLGAVLNEMPIEVGDEITEKDTKEIIQALYRTGFFKTVELIKSGEVLVVNVVEKPSIFKINLTGLTSPAKVEKILKEEELVEGRIYDVNVVRRAKNEIRKHFLKQGRYGVEIETSVELIERNRVILNIKVYEGSVARLKKIKIVGNNSFSDRKLISKLNHAPTNITSFFSKDDHYTKEKLDADLEQLRTFYMDNGFINFEILSTQVSLSEDRKKVFITINISEGDVYRIKDVRLAGDIPVSRSDLEKHLKEIKPNSVFSRKDLIEVISKIKDHLGDAGFSLADVIPLEEVDDTDKTISFIFKVDPKQRIYVRRLTIKGNHSTEDRVVRRQIPQMESTWLSKTKLKDGKENIEREGFAKEVKINEVKVPGTEDLVDVVYEFDEQKFTQFSASFGYSQADKFMFDFTAALKNSFGTGKDIDFTFRKTSVSKVYQLGYFNPYYTIDGIGFGFNAYSQKTNLSKTSNVGEFVRDDLGGGLYLVLPLSRFDSVRFGIGYDRNELKFDRTKISPEMLDSLDRNRNLTKFDEYHASMAWGYNSLDHYIFPTKGWSQGISAKVSFPSSSIKYYTVNYNATGFYPLWKKGWIFSLSANLGFIDGYGKRIDPNSPEGKKIRNVVPFYKHYYAGGAETVRGFEENSLGPKDSRGYSFGGNAMAVGKLALIFPNPIKPDAESIRTSLFMDIGQVYQTHRRYKKYIADESTNFVHMRYSVGVSLIWHSPLGAPLSFSWAYPLNAKNGDTRKYGSFSMGTTF